MSRTRSLATLAVTAACLLTPAAANAGNAFSIEAGRDPSVLADPATGAAKLVWVSKDEYSVRFCSVAPGTTSCTPQTLFQQTPTVPNQVGTPQLLRDTDGTLYIVLHRYVNDSAWLIKSSDGGATWSPAIKIQGNGSGTGFHRPVFGPLPGQITLGTWNPSRYVRTAKLDGSQAASTAVADLDSGAVSSLVYDFTVANNGSGLIGAAQNLANAYYWTLAPGNDPSDKTKWAGPTLIGAAGDIAFGGSRAGAPYLLDVGGANVEIRKWNGAGFNAPQALEPTGGYIPAIGASPSGTIAAMYRLNGYPNSERVAISTDGGATWSARTIAMSDAVYMYPSVSPTDSGDGWAAWVDGADNVTLGDLSATTNVTCTPTFCPPAPPPIQPPPPSGGLYTGPVRTARTTDSTGTYTLNGVPRTCLAPGATFKVTMGYKRRSRSRNNRVIKIRRADFYIAGKRVKIDKKAPFVQRLTVAATAARGSTVKLRARAFMKVRRGKSPTKSVYAKIQICS